MHPPQQFTLDVLGTGDAACVLRVDGEDDLAERLEDLGFWPGTPVSVGRRAPLGDPVEYRLRGYRLALRRAEAVRVVVTTGG